MSDEIRSNLEPIGEEDLALEKKFVQGGSLEKEKSSLPEKKAIPDKKPEHKERAKESENKYRKIVAKVKSRISSSDEESIDDEAEVISKEKDVETKVQSLVNIAENKGVFHAVKVAKHLDDNYIIDELHDRLLGDELHKALVEKKLIQDI